MFDLQPFGSGIIEAGDGDPESRLAVVIQVFVYVFKRQTGTVFLSPILQRGPNRSCLLEIRNVVASVTAVTGNGLSSKIGQLAILPFGGIQFPRILTD